MGKGSQTPPKLNPNPSSIQAPKEGKERGPTPPQIKSQSLINTNPYRGMGKACYNPPQNQPPIPHHYKTLMKAGKGVSNPPNQTPIHHRHKSLSRDGKGCYNPPKLNPNPSSLQIPKEGGKGVPTPLNDAPSRNQTQISTEE